MARRWPVYRLRPEALSTGNAQVFRISDHSNTPVNTRTFSTADESSLNSCRAALRPYSWVVLAVQFEGRNRNGGSKPPSFRPINAGQGPSLTGQGPNGIVPALIHRPIEWLADGNWALVWLRQAIFDRRRRGRRAWTRHGRAAHIDRGRPRLSSSAMSRRCRSTAAPAASSIAAAFRCSGLPARF